MKFRIPPRAVCGYPPCVALLVGCSSITGLDGSSQYACKAPEGVKCESVSGTYHNAIHNNLPAQRRPAGTPNPDSLSLPQTTPPVRESSRSSPSSLPTATGNAAGVRVTPEASAYLAAPLRAAPRVLRLWIKPWEDADRDLNGESLVYVQIDNGRWLVDHVQRQTREPYAPARPARLPTTAAKGSAPGTPVPDARPASQQGQSTVDDGSAIAQTLRAPQGRPAAAPGN